MRQNCRSRMSVLCGFAAAISCAALVSSASAAAVPLVDPGLELGTPAGAENTGGWSFFNGASQSNDIAHSGNFSMKLPDNLNVPGAFETYNIGVTPGAKFDFTAFGLTSEKLAPPGAANNNTSFGGIQATFFSGDNGAGTNLGTIETGAGNAIFSNHIDSTSPVGVWIPLNTGVFTAPAGAQSIQIFGIGIFPQGQDASGAIYVDDFALNTVSVPEPTSISLLALGAIPMLRRRRST
jgi:hypothetical protein